MQNQKERSSEKRPPVTSIPLIVVEGFLSTTGAVDWSPLRKYVGGYEDMLPERQVMIASVGPVSSLHDRACELYYTIKGGTVDYGAEHARRFRHKRYGRHHSVGLYTSWSYSKPLHFLGHSIGGTTIMKLQYLLSIGFFGPEGHPDMILSVATVSAPFRGTQIVYSLGEREDSAPAVRPLSVGSIIAKAVHILSYLSPLLPKALDLHADSRALSYQECNFTSFLKHLWRSDWAEGRDATPFDVTFEAADERDANEEGACHPRTYYTSYTSFMTARLSSDEQKHGPQLSDMLFPPFYLAAGLIGSFDFSSLRPQPSFLLDQRPSSYTIEHPESQSPLSHSIRQDELSEHYWANDGVVPVFSQWHPRECTATKCIHHEEFTSPRTPRTRKRLEPGIWNVYTIGNLHHLSILPLWVGSSYQIDFWTALADLLDGVEADEIAI